MSRHLNVPMVYISRINRRAEAVELARAYVSAVGTGDEAARLRDLVDFFNVHIAPTDVVEREWYNYMAPIVDSMLTVRRRTTEIVAELQAPTSHKPEHVSRKQNAIMAIMRTPGPLDAYLLIAGRTELAHLLRMEHAPRVLHYDGTRYSVVENVIDAGRARRRPESRPRPDPPLRAEAEDLIGVRPGRGRSGLRQTMPRVSTSLSPTAAAAAPIALSRVALAARNPLEAAPPTASEVANWNDADDLAAWMPDSPAPPGDDNLDDWMPDSK